MPGSADEVRTEKVPKWRSPTLATLTEKRFSDSDWIFERKLDGVRGLAFRDGGHVRLMSRNHLALNNTYPEIVEALAAQDTSRFVVDGEVVAFEGGAPVSPATGPLGITDPEVALASRIPVFYYVFDLLHLDGNAPGLCLYEAKKAVTQCVSVSRPLRYTTHRVRTARPRTRRMHAATRRDRQAGRRAYEGSARRTGSSSSAAGPGVRDRRLHRAEGQPSRAGRAAGGLSRRNDLVYAGKVGTGFDTATLRNLRNELSRIGQDTPPITRGLVREPGAHWVRPKLVAQVAFSEWTRDGSSATRATSACAPTRAQTKWSGRRADAPNQGRHHPPGPGAVPRRRHHEGRTGRLLRRSGRSDGAALKGRPLTLWRYPRGIDEQGFVQQDFAATLPDWMGSAEVAKEGGTVVHPVADRREALVWLANQNCVTPHCWLSRRDRLDEPDQIVFDLDPSTSDFAAVRAAAPCVRRRAGRSRHGVLLKTTGSRGLHVVVPISRGPDFDTVRQFARDVAGIVAADDPAHRTVEQRKDKRGDRIYLDVMRNAYAQTAVAPYAVRARRGAPVATPLEWDELDAGLRADRFTIRDVPKRIAGQGDPWADMRRHARSLSRPMQRLTKLRA